MLSLLLDGAISPQSSDRMISPETAIQFHSDPDMVVENSGEQALVAMEKAIAFQYEMYEEVNEDVYIFTPNVRTPEGEMHVQLLSHEGAFQLAEKPSSIYDFVAHFEEMVRRDCED